MDFNCEHMRSMRATGQHARIGAFTCLVIGGILHPWPSTATTLTNNLSSLSYTLVVNVGDTVVWLNPGGGTNYVESLDGEWTSGILQQDESCAFTFTKAGFYAYRMRFSTFGVVTVRAWTDAPPAVTLNIPMDGLVIGQSSPLQASTTNDENIAKIEFFANSLPIGTATNAPYVIAAWYPTNYGPSVLLAKATDRQEGVTWSSPVTVTRGPPFGVWGPRLLPSGQILFFYNAIQGSRGASYCLSRSEMPVLTNLTLLRVVASPGVFVDESPVAGAPCRFYVIPPIYR